MSAELTLSASYEPPLDLLTGRVLLITGAANGIGRALAVRAAGHGATVVLLDKHVRNLEKVYDEIENNGGPQPAIYPLDLEGADPDHYQQLAETLEQNFGALHAVVHNAANLGKLAPVGETVALILNAARRRRGGSGRAASRGSRGGAAPGPGSRRSG